VKSGLEYRHQDFMTDEKEVRVVGETGILKSEERNRKRELSHKNPALDGADYTREKEPNLGDHAQARQLEPFYSIRAWVSSPLPSTF